MSRDLVVVVVPWMQELHYGDGYEDYWRVSPFALRRMFSENDMELVHLVANNGKKESVYILAIGSKQPEKWKDKLKIDTNIFKNLGGNIIKS